MLLSCFVLFLWLPAAPGQPANPHEAQPRDQYRPPGEYRLVGSTKHCGPWIRDSFVSMQVNVDASGCNIAGDAANEPSIAIDPTNPSRIVIGWRQFDSVESDFRQAGWAYSHDSGATWTFPGVLDTGVFGSDPVLAADSKGVFYYLTINFDEMRLFKSFDSAVTWDTPIQVAKGFADKPWITIDQSGGLGDGNVYLAFAGGAFWRSIDTGLTFSPVSAAGSLDIPTTFAVARDGTVFNVGRIERTTRIGCERSSNAADPALAPVVDLAAEVDLGGSYPALGASPVNPNGLLGQPWIAASSSTDEYQDFVYILAPMVAPYPADMSGLNVIFARSRDRGQNWGTPQRINDDGEDSPATQWFPMMSIAPNGRIDAVWNDTRNDPTLQQSELYYAYSIDAGRTWSTNRPVSLPFNQSLGYPGGQQKLGDYYHMLSDDLGVSVAYAATFNGEQDIYFLRIPFDGNANGLPDVEEIATGMLTDTDGNLIPDEYEPDLDGDGLIDRYDPDFDNDGVINAGDFCAFGPVGIPAQPDGRPLGDAALAGDCSIDLVDFHYLMTFGCFTAGGPGGPPPTRGCRALDFDSDADVDLRDVSRFQNIFGSSAPL